MNDNPGPLPPRPVYIGSDVHYVSRGSADGVYPPTCRVAEVVAVEIGSHDPSDAQQVLFIKTMTGQHTEAVSEHQGTSRPGRPDTWVHCTDTPDRGPKFEPGTWHWPTRQQ